MKFKTLDGLECTDGMTLYHIWQCPDGGPPTWTEFKPAIFSEDRICKDGYVVRFDRKAAQVTEQEKSQTAMVSKKTPSGPLLISMIIKLDTINL